MQFVRKTSQRQAILDSLKAVDTHPTADELYEMVRKNLPNISLGTVYRNLEKFAENGEILMLDASGGRRRYDGNVVDHLHFFCRKCGKVHDIHSDRVKEVRLILEGIASQFTVESYSLMLDGLCPSCVSKRSIQ